MTGMANSPGHPAGRGAVGLVVLAAHLLLVAWLARSTWQPPQPVVATPLSVSIIQPAPSQPSAPPLPAPRLTPIQTAVVVPEVTVQLPSTAAITPEVTAPRPISSAAAAPAASREPVVISNVAYLRPPQPRYPVRSRRAHEEGLVVLRVLIDGEGHARQVTVVRSSGHPRLDAAACEAVSLALFKPLLTDGMPRAALATIPVEFSLHPV